LLTDNPIKKDITMKKTLTVNLGGTVFHIDEDAYRLLDNYLCNLKLHFRSQKGAEEIVDDIENRISELFLEKINAGSQVITLTDVEEIITRVGKPEDFGTETEDEEEKVDSTNSGNAKTSYTYTSHRRLYRNPDDKILGGVLSGLAVYWGWDTTVLRLIAVFLLVFGYGTLIPIYIICWLVIPEARTAAEKLNMRGEDITIENIGKTVTDGFEKVANGVNNYMNSDKPRTFIQKLGDAFVSVIGFFLKACLVVLAIIFSPVLFVFAILFIALVIATIAIAIGGGALLYEMLPLVDWTPLASVSPLMTVVGSLGGVVMVGIPLAAIIYTILRQIFHWSPMATGLKWSLFILWLLGVALFLINLSALGWQLPLYGIHTMV
jgi:phage shock protein PspC (stress-responsive transcriptional regulator)